MLPSTIYIEHDHPEPASVSVIVGDSKFQSLDFQITSINTQTETLGWTEYTEMTVRGSCSCEKDKNGKSTSLSVKYTVKWGANIYIRSFLHDGIEYDRPLSREGVVGHEQRHVKGAITLIDAKVISPFLRKDIMAKTETRCREEAKANARTAQRVLRELLDVRHEKHSDKRRGDSAYRDMPISGKRYQYIDLVWF
jgi:hypothetical protein